MAFEAKRGTNISHWLSQSAARGEQRRAYFTEDDVKRIADWGFDHIRLPIDEEQMWAADGTRESEAFDLLNNALDWCEKAGLKTIVDLHILRSHYFNDATEPKLYSDPAALEQFADLWRDLSAAMRERPTGQVAYELLNEAVARDSKDWNRVSGYVFQAVRDLEPTRYIVLGSNKFCQTHTFPDLAVPDDDHLILTFHYYNPMFITHHTAGWTPAGKYTGPIQYPGVQIPDEGLEELDRVLPETGRADNQHHDRDVIRQQVKIAYDVAQQHDKPLYCGEFGIISVVPDDIKQRWYADVIAVFDEFGIGWANWDYKGNFGLATRDGQEETGVRAMLGL